MSQQLSPAAAFLTHTYEMVDDCVTDDLICWGITCRGFKRFTNDVICWRFARDLLPKYFKHNYVHNMKKTIIFFKNTNDIYNNRKTTFV